VKKCRRRELKWTEDHYKKNPAIFGRLLERHKQKSCADVFFSRGLNFSAANKRDRYILPYLLIDRYESRGRLHKRSTLFSVMVNGMEAFIVASCIKQKFGQD
jgi:hypothetical protein